MSNGTHSTVSGWTGWIVFAAALMVIGGVLQILYGLAAIMHAHWFVYAGDHAYLINTASWGWWLILVGILIGVSGALLWNGNMFGRVIGAVLAFLSLLANLAVFASAPVWTILVIVADVLVIYAIVAHGNEMRQLMHS